METWFEQRQNMKFVLVMMALVLVLIMALVLVLMLVLVLLVMLVLVLLVMLVLVLLVMVMTWILLGAPGATRRMGRTTTLSLKTR